MVNLTSKHKKIIKKYLFVLSFLAIPIAHFIVFYLIVNVESILLAFKVPSGQNIWYNFKVIFNEFSLPTSDYPSMLLNTIKYFLLTLCFLLPVSFFLSYFFYKKIKGGMFFKIILCIPMIIPATVLTSIYKRMLEPQGMLDIFNQIFGTNLSLMFTGSTEQATLAILIYVAWTGFGYNTLLISGAMSKMPKEIIEAGRIDGIGTLREIWNIIIPLTWSTVSMLLIITISGVFMSTGPILLFANGTFQTKTISFYIFMIVNGGNIYAYPTASALGLMFTIFSIPLVILVRVVMSRIYKEVEY